jgi:hypothetical protein
MSIHARPFPLLEPRLFVHPSIVTILGTYRCTAMCSNCCFDSNPWIRQQIDLDKIVSFIDEASQNGSTKLVVFSGGECFLLGDDLVAAVAFATSKGLATRCVTNGYWAKSMDAGRRRLAQLKEAGLTELNVSTGDFHQEFVNQETVVNALCLGVELKMKHTLLVVELRRDSKVKQATILRNERVSELDRNSPGNGFRITQSPWMPMKAEEVIDQPDGMLINRSNIQMQARCESIFKTAVLTPSGDVGLCCGLSREKIPELNAPWSEGRLSEIWEKAIGDFVKIWIFVEGPARILAWAATKDSTIQWENRYAHKCHACLALFEDARVREVIRKHYKERMDSILIKYSSLVRRQELLEGVVYG